MPPSRFRAIIPAKGGAILRAIQVQVFCDALSKEMTTYCYIQQIGEDFHIVPNGCEECNGSSVCKECFEKQRKLAVEQLTTASNTVDFLFNQP